MKRNWSEKLAAPAEAKVKPAPVDMAGMKKGEIMLVPTPRMIDDFIRALPEGCSLDVCAMRQALARANGAQVTCPITVGFHLRIVAEAAFEAFEAGVPIDAITPFWRVLDGGSPTTARLACGVRFIRAAREREGLPDEPCSAKRQPRGKNIQPSAS